MKLFTVRAFTVSRGRTFFLECRDQRCPQGRAENMELRDYQDVGKIVLQIIQNQTFVIISQKEKQDFFPFWQNRVVFVKEKYFIQYLTNFNSSICDIFICQMRSSLF